MELLPRLHNARTVRVVEPNLLIVNMDVGFGTQVVRQVKLEGIDDRFVPRDSRSSALHALVVLCGGKSLLVQADPSALDSPILARVFLDEKLNMEGPWMLRPHGLSENYLEVSEFQKHIKEHDFDIKEVKRVLNTKRK